MSRRPGQVPKDNTLIDSPFARRTFGLRNIASILLALVVLYLVYQELLGLEWGEVWTSVQEANLELFALAFALFYCSFPLRALRWKVLLANVGYDSTGVLRPMPSVLSLTRIMYLGCFANCLALARLGDAYRAYLLKNKLAGVSFVLTLGTVLAERLLDLLVLAAMMGASLLVVFGGTLPMEVTQALTAGLILSSVGVLGILSMQRFRWAFERILPKRLHAHYARLEHGLLGSFRRRLPLVVGYSAAGWIIEGSALYVIAAALGIPVSVGGALLVALAGALLSTVPITPAGLGFTEGGMILMLGWLVGLDTYSATAITLLFRIINYWSIIVFGLVIYIFFSRGRTRRRSSPTPSSHQRKINRTIDRTIDRILHQRKVGSTP